ncbi:MAG: hypothetical protein WBP44_17285 [Gammaproteobacteria bacterium]
MDFFLTLQQLIETHPQYPSVSDDDLKIWCEAEGTVNVERERVTADEIYAVVDPVDFNKIDDLQWWIPRILQDGLDVKSPNSVKTVFADAIKEPSKSAFLALTVEDVSRLVSVGLPSTVTIGQIEYARVYVAPPGS